MAKFTESVEGIMEIAQGTVAFPSIETLPSPQSSKISGFEMPPVVDSVVNFKCAVPTDLDAAPNGKIRVFYMTLTTNSAANVDIEVSTHATSDAGVVNTAFIVENQVSTPVPATAFSLKIVDVTLTNAPVNSQFITGQIRRVATSIGDTAQKILLMKVQLLVDVDVT